jgi:DNA-binding transcriptional LysR family regulator
MEIRWMRAFIAVAEELNFGRAAQRLHVAQPAVSQQIFHLERHLGIQLFERNKRTVRLTDAGDAFLEPCAPRYARLKPLAAKPAMQARANSVRSG